MCEVTQEIWSVTGIWLHRQHHTYSTYSELLSIWQHTFERGFSQRSSSSFFLLSTSFSLLLLSSSSRSYHVTNALVLRIWIRLFLWDPGHSVQQLLALSLAPNQREDIVYDEQSRIKSCILYVQEVLTHFTQQITILNGLRLFVHIVPGSYVLSSFLLTYVFFSLSLTQIQL